jgi:hypothetical protein
VTGRSLRANSRGSLVTTLLLLVLVWGFVAAILFYETYWSGQHPIEAILFSPLIAIADIILVLLALVATGVVVLLGLAHRRPGAGATRQVGQ